VSTALEPDSRQIARGFPASVLMVVDNWSSGGLENLVVDLSENLAALGMSVFVGVANGPPLIAGTFAPDSGIQTLSFDGDEAAFAAFLHREPVDLVNYHHCRFGIDTARRYGIGTVYTIYNCYLWMDDQARKHVALGLANMDAVIALSPQVARFAQVQFRCPAEKIKVIGVGLRVDAIPAPERPAAARGEPFTVVIVGSFNRLKLQHVAIAAFCRAADEIPELRLRLIGAPLDRDYYFELRAQIADSHHRDRIEIIPGLSRADTFEAMADAHLFVSASSVEGYGLALVEAAAAGCVCICTDVGCARELYVDGGAVLVIPSPLGELDYVTQSHFYAAIASELPRHRDTLAERICQVWREYASFAAGVPKTRTWVHELCSMQRFTEQHLDVYGMAHRQARAAVIAVAAAEAAAYAEALDAVRSEAAQQIGMIEATINRTIGECANLTRGIEAAQRWLLESLTALDPNLISNQEISPVPEGWPADHPDDLALHQATLARLIEGVDRANRIGMAFHEQATHWQAERGEDTQRLRQMRSAMEKAVAERDRARSQVRSLAQTAPAQQTRLAASGTAGQEAPLVSIALPVYDQAYLVDEAVAGILSQTYRNWELIVLDDGSADDLECRVRRYLGDRRVVFLRQPNQKLPAALNHAFGFARGELLTWTSADNIMLPAQLERLVEELLGHPEAGLVYSDYWTINDKGEPLDDPSWRAHNRDPEIPGLIRLPHAATIENFHQGDNFIGASFLYRREIADIVGRYADDAFGGEDYDFWLRMHLVTEFRHVAEPLYKYRVHDNTLTSRAEELGLDANIRELLEADRWRIDSLLSDGVLHSGDSALRPVGQFPAALLKRCRPVAYHSLGERGTAGIPAGPAVGDGAFLDPVIIDIDVPARAIDTTLLRDADILLCRSELTATLLRREDWARDKRVLVWNGKPTPALRHAFIQAFADQVTSPIPPPMRRPPPRIDEPFRPSRILLLVDRWSSGGLENIVIDLARSFAGNGRVVFVASAEATPPPASAFAGASVQTIKTLSFHGDENAFDSFLRREAIEVVNYHHSSFAIGRAKQQAAATVYTMHNCYLWMDDAARQQVALRLAGMDRIIAVSRQVAQFAVAQFGVPCDRIVVVPNGLSDDIMRRVTPPSGRRMWSGDAPFTVAMVASLTRPKLQHVAIAAFAEAAPDIPQMRLRLIGTPLDRDYREELGAQIAAAPHGHRIELIPGLTRTETIAALAEAQVFLLPSLVEGCSMALLEAAAAGCVCIACDVGGARDLLVSNGSVVLIPSPLGELDRVTQRQFTDAAMTDLPEHRRQVAEALRTVWRDYGSLAAGVGQTHARLCEISGMRQMTDAYLLAYTLAFRGGDPGRRKVSVEPAVPVAADRRVAPAS
jgi:O-antigen biosynthesis protein